MENSPLRITANEKLQIDWYLQEIIKSFNKGEIVQLEHENFGILKDTSDYILTILKKSYPNATIKYE